MPFVNKSDANHFLPSDPRKIFIGRTGELQFFAENILKAIEPAHNIISISGQGGVGKSTLLTQFINLALSPDFAEYCLIALADERQVTPANIMEKFATQLHMTGEFEKALTRYKETLHRLQSGQEALRDALLGKAPDLAGSMVEDLPIIGGLLREGAKAATELIVNEHRTRQLLRDAERLENPIRDLTKAFVEELNHLATTQIPLSFNRGKRQRRVLLFFDTFEQLGIEAAPWLLDYFLQTDISNNVVVVIAGRDPIERSTPNDPKRWLPYLDQGTIYSISLNSFDEEETRMYLTMRGVTDPERIATIWRLSYGLPLYLGLLTSNQQGAVDPTKDVVVNFLRWIPEQEHLKRRLALDASLLSRPFNQDDLEAFPYLPEQERPSFYQWLTALPFVRSSPQDGRYTYHDLAQTLFSRHLFQRSRKGYYATRRYLADYYRGQLEKTQAKSGEASYSSAAQGRAIFYSREWIELAMAVAYQLFLLPDDASHESAMQQILFAYEFTDHNEEIIRVLRILSQKQLDDQVSISVQQTARQLLWYIEADGKQETKKELLAAADALLKVIVNRSSFPVGLLAHIYRKRGFAFRSLNQFEQAIIDYTRAIELDPTYARAYASRGSAYRRLKEYERAMQDYNRALELEPNYAWAYCGRGETYRLLKEYALALADLNRAVELEPNYARAYAQRALLHLWLGKMELARLDYIQAWESSATLVNAAWMAEWCTMCQGNIGAELIQRLEAITAAHPYHYVGYICRGVMLWQQQQYNAALLAFEQAIQLEPEAWDAYFWKGMVHATLSQDVDAAVAVENALASGIPPVLLSPLQWLALKRPDFYERYVIPLLTSSNS